MTLVDEGNRDLGGWRSRTFMKQSESEGSEQVACSARSETKILVSRNPAPEGSGTLMVVPPLANAPPDNCRIASTETDCGSAIGNLSRTVTMVFSNSLFCLS